MALLCSLCTLHALAMRAACCPMTVCTILHRVCTHVASSHVMLDLIADGIVTVRITAIVMQELRSFSTLRALLCHCSAGFGGFMRGSNGPGGAVGGRAAIVTTLHVLVLVLVLHARRWACRGRCW